MSTEDEHRDENQAVKNWCREVEMTENTIDVLIPSYRPGEKFARLLSMLERQQLKPSRVIILNTEERYWRPELLEGLSAGFLERIRLEHLPAEAFDHGGTRNALVKLSEAPFFLLMTDDAVPADAELTAQLLRCFEDENVGAAYARQLAGRAESFIEAQARSFNYPPQSCKKSLEDLPRLGIKTFFCSNACCAYRRSDFERLGGFAENSIFNEDMVYAAGLLRSGHSLIYCAQARVYHSHHYTALQQLKRNFDLGVSQRMHPEVFEGISSEKEGIRLIKSQLRALLRRRQPLAVPGLLLHSACKYLGYRLGLAYRRLPRPLIKKLSMQAKYWDKRGRELP